MFRSGQGAIFHEKKQRANQTRGSKYLTAAKNMVIANGRSPRRKRTTSPEERVEEIVGEMPEISQPLPGSPGRLTKLQQRNQRAAKLNEMKQTRRTTAVGSCSSTPPSRDSIEFGSLLSSQNSMASQSERQQHLSPGAWTKAQQRKQHAVKLAMTRRPSPALPILPCKLDESDETDDVAESTSIAESTEPESTSASSANDASSEEGVDDDDPEGEDDEDDERDDEAGYDDDEEDEVSGSCSEEEAGGEDIENVSY